MPSSAQPTRRLPAMHPRRLTSSLLTLWKQTKLYKVNTTLDHEQRSCLARTQGPATPLCVPAITTSPSVAHLPHPSPSGSKVVGEPRETAKAPRIKHELRGRGREEMRNTENKVGEDTNTAIRERTVHVP